MATLGTTSTPTSTNHVNGDADKLIGSGPYTMTEAGVATKISQFIRNTSGGTLKQRCAIYVNNAGVPGALVGVSAEVLVATGTGSPDGAWVDFAVTGTLSNATGYWIAFWPHDNTMDLYYNATGPGSYTGAVAYSTAGAAPDPFGTGTPASPGEYAIYITYTPTTAPPLPPGYAQQAIPFLNNQRI